MESIIAKALEYTLKYWLKSFSRDQFKLQGRTAQLSNLDINGDALHASAGLPAALDVERARVGKLEITLPSVSNVQVEPIIVKIDRLDLVLKENADPDSARSHGSNGQSSSSYAKSSGYGYADKIADGMTIQVGIVNLLIETCGGARGQNTATWASPLASITMRNLLLYTTNEKWKVVNLKEARDFSNNKKNIYVFKKLEWASLSVDLLPHPDMFMDSRFASSDSKESQRDDDGAKRLFFGGERFLEGISGQACITIKRTKLNNPLGLEVQLHIPEAVCPALSEPGLRALLRFMTGFYVCLNRGDVDPLSSQSEAAGCSLVSITVDHIFLCIKDAEFQLELLMQSLLFSRASLSDGKRVKNLSSVVVGGLFLRDTFSRPPCTLIQPSMQAANEDPPNIPEFAKNFCPPIFPLGDNSGEVRTGAPLICLHSLQINPCTSPFTFASQTVIECQPILIDLQEASCLRISSFLADGIVVNPGSVLPSWSISSFMFNLKGFDLTVPLDAEKASSFVVHDVNPSGAYFSGARLHVKDFCFVDSPSIKCKLLNLDKDPACFSLWDGQPIDASQKKWTVGISHLSLSLENCSDSENTKCNSSLTWWKCVELHEACFEAAMVTADGCPILIIPPPEGIVRIGMSCKKCFSNTSIEQLFFVLDVYSYFGEVSEKLKKISKTNCQKNTAEELMLKIPSDTAVILSIHDLQLKFLESSSFDIQGMPLVQFSGDDLFVKVSHRTFGGAFAVSTNLTWNRVQVECVDTDGMQRHESHFHREDGQQLLVNGDHSPYMRAVFWIDSQRKHLSNSAPFLEINLVHVVPYKVEDTECHSLNIAIKIAGVRLGGGMSYTEALLHRFGILGPDGGPGDGLQKGLQNLSSGPLANLFKSTQLGPVDAKEDISENGASSGLVKLGRPDDIDVCVELEDWLFALEGTPDSSEEWSCYNYIGTKREDACWHMTFSNLQVKAKSDPKADLSVEQFSKEIYPVNFVMVAVEGLQALKPQGGSVVQSGMALDVKSLCSNKMERTTNHSDKCGGLNVGISLVASQSEENAERATWEVENIKFSVKEQFEATATKSEIEQLLILCKSEIDSMGRIAVGILRILKLEESIGKGAIDQLSSLGSEGLDRIFTPEKLSRRDSMSSVSFTPSNRIGDSPFHNLESTINSLECVLGDSQAKCSALLVEPSSPEIPTQHLADIKQLNQKLEYLQILLTRLRTQI